MGEWGAPGKDLQPTREAWYNPKDKYGFRDQDYGGNHILGTGTYEANTLEQAKALYDQLPKGDGPPPPSPPMSTTGKSYYETNNFTGATTDPRGGRDEALQGRWGSQGQIEGRPDDIEGDEDDDPNADAPSRLFNWAAGQTIFGRILKLFGR